MNDDIIYEAPLSGKSGTFRHLKCIWRRFNTYDQVWFIELAKELGRSDEIGMFSYKSGKKS